jgi:hypothetical protein
VFSVFQHRFRQLLVHLCFADHKKCFHFEPALAAALERPTFNVQTILWHQVAGPLLKSVLEFRNARNADEQKLSQARVRSSGGNGAGDWLLAIPFCPELQIDNKDFCIAMCKRLGVSQKGLDLHLVSLVLEQMEPYFIHLRIRTLSRARGSLVMLSLCTPTLFVVMTPSNSSLERCSLRLARPAFSKNLL